MSHIPEGARWYVADIVLEHEIEGDPRNVVHVNLHLIEADSPERAYRKAVDLGRSSEQEYLNTDGKRVRVRFRGLRELAVIHDELEDGAELLYEETVGVTEDQLRRWIRPRDSLSVFETGQIKAGIPNYMPEEIMKMLGQMGCQRDE